eukprot:7633416-Lingulodinium_polyedra.AAC.1
MQNHAIVNHSRGEHAESGAAFLHCAPDKHRLNSFEHGIYLLCLGKERARREPTSCIPVANTAPLFATISSATSATMLAPEFPRVR